MCGGVLYTMHEPLTEFTAKEAVLCRQSGLNRSVVRSVRRELREGVDWRQEGKEIAYSPEGLRRLQEKIMARDKGEAQKNAQRGAGEPDGPVLGDPVAEKKTAGVITGLPKNRRIVFAEVAGRPARVRVRSSEHFVVGMELADLVHVDEDLFDYTGRYPRARGAW